MTELILHLLRSFVGNIGENSECRNIQIRFAVECSAVAVNGSSVHNLPCRCRYLERYAQTIAEIIGRAAGNVPQCYTLL